MAFRCKTALLYPSMPLEDGRELYTYFSENHSLSSLYRFYAGYVSLLPNMAGYAVVRMPPAWAPYFLAIHALFWCMAARMVFGLRRFRFLLPDDRVRILIGLYLCIYPIGNYAKTSVTMFQHFHMLWVLALLLIAPLPKSRPSIGVQAALQAIMVWSHPLAILLSPLAAWNLLRRRTKSSWLCNGVFLVAAASYALYGVQFQSNHERSWSALLRGAGQYFTERVFVEGFLGNPLRMHLASQEGHATAALLCVVLIMSFIALGFGARKRLGRRGVGIAALGIVGVFLFTLIVVYARNLDTMPKYYDMIWGQRYFYIQHIALMSLFLSLLYYAISGSSYPRSMAALASVFLVGWAVYMNVRNWDLFVVSPEPGKQVAAFMQRVEEMRSKPSEFPEDKLVLNRGRWSIQVPNPVPPESRCKMFTMEAGAPQWLSSQAVCSKRADYAHSGKQGLWITSAQDKPWNTAFGLNEDGTAGPKAFQCKPDSLYEISAWIRGVKFAPGEQVVFTIRGNRGKTLASGCLVITEAWQQLVVEVQTAPITDAFTLAFSTEPARGGIQYAIDDIVIQPK